jgi:hypothetical protein
MQACMTQRPPVMAGVMLSLSAAPFLNAQDVLLNVPYACRSGITLTVQRCQPGADGEVCTYERKLSTGQVSFPSVRRTTLINLLKPCQPMQASAPAAAPAKPQAAQQAPAAPARTQATNPPYLGQFPSVERVNSEVKGADAMDTAARQMGAFWQLQEIIKEMSGLRWTGNALTADEKRLLGQYAAAYQEAALPYASTPDRSRWYQMHALYETSQGFRDELFGKLLSPSVQGQWAQTKGDTRARVENSKQKQEADFQRFRAGIAKDSPMSQREWAHCLAAGTESICLKRLSERTILTSSGAQVMDTLGAMFGLSEDKAETVAPGLALAGAYSGAGGLRMSFGAAGAASVTCGDVAAPAGYKVERQGNQLQVRLVARQAAGPRLDKMLAAQSGASVSASADPDKWQDQRIVLTLRPDGGLAGAGTLKVTGPVAVGTRQGTKTTTVYTATGKTTREEPVTEAVCENRAVACALGALAAAGKVSAVESGAGPAGMLAGVHGIGQIMDALNSAFSATSVEELKNLSAAMANRDPDPGLRMQGRYAAPGGLDIVFLHNAAVVGCRQAAFAQDYKVSASGNRVLVTIQNAGSQISLELTPGGTLAGSGAVKLEGNALVGMDVNNRPVFQPVSETCPVNVLSPAGR